MEGGEERQLEFEQMKVAAEGGFEGKKVVEEAEKQKLIDACEEAGVAKPDEKEVERIIKNGKNSDRGEHTSNGRHDWTRDQEEKEEAAREHLQAVIREQEERKRKNQQNS